MTLSIVPFKTVRRRGGSGVLAWNDLCPLFRLLSFVVLFRLSVSFVSVVFSRTHVVLLYYDGPRAGTVNGRSQWT